MAGDFVPQAPDKEYDKYQDSLSIGRLDQELPQLSPRELAANNAQLLSREVEDMRKGSPSEGRSALSGIHEMQREGLMPLLVNSLEKSGNAKIQYGQNGEPEHIVFGADGNKTDIDLKNDTINGKSDAQLKSETISQANDYFSSALSNPRLFNSGDMLNPATQAKVKDLMSAYFDGNVQKMTNAAQEILKDPSEAKLVESALQRINIPGSIRVANDKFGQLFMQTTTGNSDTVVIRPNGAATAYNAGLYGEPDFSKPANLSKAMDNASNQALFVASDSVRSAQRYLEMYKKLPADGYSNMGSLERAYRN